MINSLVSAFHNKIFNGRLKPAELKSSNDYYFRVASTQVDLSMPLRNNGDGTQRLLTAEDKERRAEILSELKGKTILVPVLIGDNATEPNYYAFASADDFEKLTLRENRYARTAQGINRKLFMNDPELRMKVVPIEGDPIVELKKINYEQQNKFHQNLNDNDLHEILSKLNSNTIDTLKSEIKAYQETQANHKIDAKTLAGIQRIIHGNSSEVNLQSASSELTKIKKFINSINNRLLGNVYAQYDPDKNSINQINSGAKTNFEKRQAISDWVEKGNLSLDEIKEFCFGAGYSSDTLDADNVKQVLDTIFPPSSGKSLVASELGFESVEDLTDAIIVSNNNDILDSIKKLNKAASKIMTYIENDDRFIDFKKDFKLDDNFSDDLTLYRAFLNGLDKSASLDQQLSKLEANYNALTESFAKACLVTPKRREEKFIANIPQFTFDYNSPGGASKEDVLLSIILEGNFADTRMKYLGSVHAKAVMESVNSYESKLPGSSSIIQKHFNCKSKEELVDYLSFAGIKYTCPDNSKRNLNEYVNKLLEHSTMQSSGSLDTLETLLARDDYGHVISELDNMKLVGNFDLNSNPENLYQDLRKKIINDETSFQILDAFDGSGIIFKQNFKGDLNTNPIGNYLSVKSSGNNYLLPTQKLSTIHFAKFLGLEKSDEDTKQRYAKYQNIIKAFSDNDMDQLTKQAIQESITEPALIDDEGNMIAFAKIDLDIFESKFREFTK